MRMLVPVIVFVVFALTVHMRMSTCFPEAERERRARVIAADGEFRVLRLLSAMAAKRTVPA